MRNGNVVRATYILTVRSVITETQESKRAHMDSNTFNFDFGKTACTRTTAARNRAVTVTASDPARMIK